MRSRRDDVDAGSAVELALTRGLCGIGGRLPEPPTDLAAALRAVNDLYGERTARRLERFTSVPGGAFVWTRTVAAELFVGRIDGPWRYAADVEAQAADLVHVRPCRWSHAPVDASAVPPAVVATFARGGRNFQQIHDPAVADESASAWQAETRAGRGVDGPFAGP
jgi:hypothetical protein